MSHRSASSPLVAAPCRNRAQGRWLAALTLLAVVGCGDAKTPDAPAVPDPAPAAAASVTPVDSLQDDDARATRYAAIAAQLQADPVAAVSGKAFEISQGSLQSIADRAEDRFLRINAALLLGHMLELRGDGKGAVAYYRHATKLVPAQAGPDDAGPFMALALALAGEAQLAEAATAQARAAELDPNNLENWLALGELRIRAGDEAGATAAYVEYERVRTSLINGLTGRKKDDGDFFVAVDERIACARSLAAAVDSGTALVLLYALQTEPEATVRLALAEVMGQQRLAAYAPRLTAQSKTEPDSATKEAMVWALGEIGRDPVQVVEGDPAALPKDDPRAAPGKPRARPPGPAPAAPQP